MTQPISWGNGVTLAITRISPLQVSGWDEARYQEEHDHWQSSSSCTSNLKITGNACQPEPESRWNNSGLPVNRRTTVTALSLRLQVAAGTAAATEIRRQHKNLKGATASGY
eukprot:2233051-Rhodomonas_salina.1